MSRNKRLSHAGAEIVEALTGFLDAVRNRNGAIADRFTIRSIKLERRWPDDLGTIRPETPQGGRQG